jgi:hypothetical protein
MFIFNIFINLFVRNNSEQVAELKNLMGTKQLPVGSLALGAEGLKRGKSDTLLNVVVSYIY